MPTMAMRPCTYPRCNTLTDVGRCPEHRRAVARESDQQRGGSTARGYTYRWQKASKAFLRLHPLCQCEECDEGRKRLLPSEVVDHRVPHRGDEALFWNEKNWQAMNKECHDKKTATEDGGFGNPQQGGAGQMSGRFSA